MLEENIKLREQNEKESFKSGAATDADAELGASGNSDSRKQSDKEEAAASGKKVLHQQSLMVSTTMTQRMEQAGKLYSF